MRPLPLTFLDGPARPSMGLNALEPGDWLWPDERYTEEIALREALLRERPGEVLAVLPAAEPATAELLGLVAAFLAEHHPARFRRDDGGDRPVLVDIAGGRAVDLADPEPLRAAARLVQEDLCLMEADAEGRYRLTAAALCFPAHWRLRDKLGRPLDEIHAPVPGFAGALGRPVERLFAGLAVERPVWRANWTLVESPDLHHPHGRAPVPDLSAENAGLRLWLRVERQTLRRLPRTRAVAFTIRTLVRPLGEVAAGPAAARALAARLRELDPATDAYKGLPPLAPALLAWLDRRAAGGHA